MIKFLSLLFAFLFNISLIGASGFGDMDLSSLFGNMSSSPKNDKLKDAGGYFSVSPPKGFECNKGTGKVECVYKGDVTSKSKSKSKVEAQFTFSAFTVPKSATIALVNLNIKEKLSNKPHFSQILSRNTKLGGVKASEVAYTYDELGNVELPRLIQTIQAIKDNKLYQIKLDCLGRACGEYNDTMEALAKDFKIAKLNKEGFPVSSAMASEINSASQRGSASSPENVNATLESIFRELD